MRQQRAAFAGVALRAEEKLRPLAPQRGQTYVDVGCGNGAAVIHFTGAFGLVWTWTPRRLKARAAPRPAHPGSSS